MSNGAGCQFLFVSQVGPDRSEYPPDPTVRVILASVNRGDLLHVETVCRQCSVRDFAPAFPVIRCRSGVIGTPLHGSWNVLQKQRFHAVARVPAGKVSAAVNGGASELPRSGLVQEGEWRGTHYEEESAGDQQRGRSRYDLLIINLESCNSGRSPGGAHVRSVIQPRNVAFKIEGSFG